MSSFRQHFFSWFPRGGGDQRKNSEKIQKLYFVFSAFFPLVPPWKPWKKCCLNELKFWEASQNQKWSICWKFQYSISKIGKSPLISGSSFPIIGILFLKMIKKMTMNKMQAQNWKIELYFLIKTWNLSARFWLENWSATAGLGWARLGLALLGTFLAQARSSQKIPAWNHL